MEPLNETQQALAAEAFNRATAIAARYAKTFPQHADDLASSAAWGVMKAARSYVEGENDTWAWWSSAKAKYECLDFIRSPEVQRQMAWEEFLAEEEPVIPEPTYPEPYWEEGVETMLRGLPPKYRALCDMVYAVGMTTEAAAVQLGYSPKHGHKIHRQALDLLRRKLTA